MKKETSNKKDSEKDVISNTELEDKEFELVARIIEKKEEISKAQEKLKSLSYKKRIQKVVRESKFMEFFKSKKTLPIPEKTQEAPKEIDLEKIALSSHKKEKPIEKNDFEYISNLQQEEEIKYIRDSKITTNLVNNPKINNAPRIQERPEIAFQPSNKSVSDNVEKYMPVKKIVDNFRENLSPREKDLFLKEEIKYKQSI